MTKKPHFYKHVFLDKFVQSIEQKMVAEWEEEFDIEVEFPKFLGEVVDRTEKYLKYTEAAEKQAEVLDQTISLLRSSPDYLSVYCGCGFRYGR